LSNRPTPIVDTIFPGQRVHLIGGASGAGKTTWLMQMIEDWRQEKPIYGFPSHPVPFVYLSYDRDTDDFIDTCDRLKIDPNTYNFVSPIEKDFDLPLLMMLEKLHKANPETKLYIVEGIASQTPDGKINDQRIVGRWLRQLQAFCKRYGVTIIGVLHAAKTKERDRYKEPRARIAGCGAWAGYSSTVVIIEEESADTDSSIRELMILPRNDKKFSFTLDFKDGRLVEVDRIVKQPKFWQWLKTIAEGEIFGMEEMSQCGLSGSRIYNEIDSAVARGKIEKVGRGKYCKKPDSVN